MRYIISTIIVLIFTACTNTAELTPKKQTSTESTLTPTKIPTEPIKSLTTQVTDTVLAEPKIVEVIAEEVTTQDVVQEINTPIFTSIVGTYKLYKGVISYSGIRKVLTDGHLVIEQLDNDDFGYYNTTQVDNHAPNSYFGIFHLKDDKYSQKVIEDNGVGAEPIVSLIENIELIVEDQKIELKINASGKTDIIWERDYLKEVKTPKMKSSLTDAKNDYIKFYKEKFSKVTDI
jgi:hypothetical protein